ncbi:FitA-like ribbon-helix-helix domain-containing protein [Candidatus Poriferisodalis sp.]|uniref:FitA-like ribbon-helix-helix domain-containing protein n=1 Tax=Candidatus Poriferisodalis sp. TaxID=3101277 RepID=UPI003B019C9B
MASIQVKSVPSDVHQTLRQRAVGAGQSLQEYLLQMLCEQARRPTLAEVLERAGGRAGGNIGRVEAVSAVRADRDSR